MSATRFHASALTSEGLGALRAHAKHARELGFYLAGGTALALQLGHRRSVDFDWFSREGFDPLRLARELSDRGVPLVSTATERGTLHTTISGVKASFLAYPYPMVEPLIFWPEESFELAAPADIAAMKLAAVAQRGARKDFYDLVALGRAGFDLVRMLESYRRKYQIQDLGHVLTALTWFEDADVDRDPLLGTSESWEEVKRTIRGWVVDLASL